MDVRIKTFPFDVRKAVQAVGVLHSAEGASAVSYYRLLKLLYIADREFLEETGRPIVGGRVVAMDFGPLSSPVYSLITGEHEDSPEWERVFSKNTRYLSMKEKPGTDEMSKKEIRKLHEVSQRLADRTDDELGVIVHEFEEYKKHHKRGTSTTIPLESALEAIGLQASKEAIVADIQRMAAGRQLLGG